ncbi:phosphoribosylamine--glycine ligase [Desulfurobacterium atlanticum]|uniref:Phosphoribosylamine--glycine ligase n=1 Tax=Desulfurobacterium atlanticum TaxID=240169 RepID=A0A238ZFY9_9BACT|nr:phosphoribosylamine--glycine ligase [Desulfurobacterium atlanticum]SNR82049.1 phosphoribosylamine--glycine ligase [Desulfurobacterium atlanticum]
MKVLIIGSGGREHALAWKVSKSPKVSKVLAIPGNPGIGRLGECINIPITDIKKIADFAESENIDLTIVGPEAPLVAGIVDEFEKRGLKIFGPSKEAARLEGSKVFSKEMMKEFGVPTADFKVFDNPDEAKEYIKEKGAPIVVKADGLAAGKGVTVAQTVEEAIEAIDRIMVNKIFGEAGNRVVVEECLKGEEASYLVISDGERYIPLAPAQDHKAVFDKDKGPNTGGMGAYSPAPVLSPEIEKEVQKKVIEPMIKGMKERGTPFKGILYAGIMITDDGIKTLEFNVRFGDPEAQVILRRLKNDFVDICFDTINGTLPENLNWDERTAICVVLASKGYPGKYEKGKEITGIDEAEKIDDVVVFHAGTAIKDGKLVTNGGRVLNVTAMGKDVKEAIKNVYNAVDKIHFDGMHFRKDIGAKALKRIKE